MPEYPDVTIYVERLDALTRGQTFGGVRLKSPFLLRTVTPPLSELSGRKILGYRRMGKRIICCLEKELFLVIHLMIAGRLRWKKAGAAIPGKNGVAALDFESGTIIFSEASSKKRAWIRVVQGEEPLAALNPGGLELFECTLLEFTEQLREHNHTLKRVLTDARLFSGIGNAYSDEILHRAKLSPVTWSTRLSDEEILRLFDATRTTLTEWTERFRSEVGDGFPDKVTAFREEMAAHGRYRQPCPVCESPIQRIRYASRETNYCATCQTGGKLLADRSLSRLLKKDWPKSLEQLEEHIQSRRR